MSSMSRAAGYIIAAGLIGIAFGLAFWISITPPFISPRAAAVYSATRDAVFTVLGGDAHTWEGYQWRCVVVFTLVFGLPVSGSTILALLAFRACETRRSGSDEFPGCTKCGYSLRGSPTSVCPECGFASTRSEQPDVRWTSRRLIAAIPAVVVASLFGGTVLTALAPPFIDPLHRAYLMLNDQVFRCLGASCPVTGSAWYWRSLAANVVLVVVPTVALAIIVNCIVEYAFGRAHRGRGRGGEG